MVQKKEEMGDSSLNGSKAGSSSGSPQDKGRKNKRKLADPSQQSATNVPSSLTEFPRYESPLLRSQNPLSDHAMGTVSNLQRLQESESAGWDDPFAIHLEELLSSNLLTVFHNAIKQIADYGYSEEVAQKAILGSGLYYGGNDLVLNIVNDILNFLKNGKEGAAGSRDYAFEDLPQLVAYTMVEMISLVKEVKPSLPTVEAMWQLLMCDLNVLQACEVEGDGFGESSPGSTLNKSSEFLSSEFNLLKPSDTDNRKPSSANNASNNPSEPLKFGSFPNLPKPRNPHAVEGKALGSDGFSSGEGVKNTSLTPVSEEKPVTSRKGRTKKEIIALRQKPSVEKLRSYGKGTYRTAKLASISGSLVEKRVKSPSDLVALHARSGSSKIAAEIGVKAPLADPSCLLSNNNASPDIPLVDTKGYVTALPASDTDTSSPAPSSSDKKSCPESEIDSSVSTKLVPDYYAGIPFDSSLGKYVPRDKKDELILKLAPCVKDLQNELQSWTKWANQKVMQAARRLTKDQPELKALRKEKEEAEQYKKEKQLLEENTMKRLSEMKFALNNATNQLEEANITARRLEVEQSLLKKEMEDAKLRAAESAESCREAKERGKKALKDAQSWEGQKILLQEELKSQREKLSELQQEVARAKNRQNQIEATWKKERAAKEKLLAQAATIEKEREQLEAFGKAEEERIKSKAENDMKYYIQNIKKLESEISKLKLKSDSSKIAALKRGIDGSYGGKSGTLATECNQTQNVANGVTNVWENFEGTKIKRERECVMCLSEEMSVIFLPCAHQVLCSKCNELHEKEGMKECPSCRATIQRRIQARFARI